MGEEQFRRLPTIDEKELMEEARGVLERFPERAEGARAIMCYALIASGDDGKAYFVSSVSGNSLDLSLLLFEAEKQLWGPIADAAENSLLELAEKMGEEKNNGDGE